LNGSTLERTQKLRLRFLSQVPHFVQKERSQVSELESTLPTGDRASEGAPFVPEHLTLDQLAGKGRAIDAYERAVTPWRQGMNRRGGELLSGPALSEDQDTCIGRTDFSDGSPHVFDGFASSDKESAGIQLFL
jgi:hypothetical protein